MVLISIFNVVERVKVQQFHKIDVQGLTKRQSQKGVWAGDIGDKLTGNMGYTLAWAIALGKRVTNGRGITICKLRS
jgi:hypothetical protein